MSWEIFNKIVERYDNENDEAMNNLDVSSPEYIKEKKLFDAMLKGIQAHEEMSIIDEINRVHAKRSGESNHTISWWMSRAAAVVLIVGAGTFFYLNNNGGTKLKEHSGDLNIDESPTFADSATYIHDSIKTVKDTTGK